MKILFNVALILFLRSFCYAQDKDISAQIHYTNAEEYYNNGTLIDYENCLYELAQAEGDLGKTNSKILYLKIMAMDKFKDFYYDYDLDTCFKRFFSYDVKSIPSDKYIEITKLKSNFRTYSDVNNRQYKTTKDALEYRLFRQSNAGFMEIFKKGLKYGTPEYKQACETNKYYKFVLGWATHLARKGNLKAMLALGEAYQYGYGISASTSGIIWYEKASNLGDTTAMDKLGDHYNYAYSGFGSDDNVKDLNKALEYYQQSEKLGSSHALLELGKLYTAKNSSPVINASKENSEKGIDFLKRAADMGQQAALTELQIIYKYGTAKGIKKDQALSAVYETKFNQLMKKTQTGAAN